MEEFQAKGRCCHVVPKAQPHSIALDQPISTHFFSLHVLPPSLFPTQESPASIELVSSAPSFAPETRRVFG